MSTGEYSLTNFVFSIFTCTFSTLATKHLETLDQPFKDKVEIDVRDEDDGKKYIISQVEVNRIELLVNGVVDEDEDDVNKSESEDEEDGPRRVQLTTRTGRSATRIRLRK